MIVSSAVPWASVIIILIHCRPAESAIIPVVNYNAVDALRGNSTQTPPLKLRPTPASDCRPQTVTLQSWAREFEKWTPYFNVVILAGSKVIANRLILQDFEVCIATRSASYLCSRSSASSTSRSTRLIRLGGSCGCSYLAGGRTLLGFHYRISSLKALFKLALLNFGCPGIRWGA